MTIGEPHCPSELHKSGDGLERLADQLSCWRVAAMPPRPEASCLEYAQQFTVVRVKRLAYER